MTNEELTNLLEVAKVVALRLQVLDIQKRTAHLEKQAEQEEVIDSKPKIWPSLAKEDE